MKRLAAIDIGTNTILMLVADITEDGKLFPLKDLERTTRLGRGLAGTGHLHPDSLSKSYEVIDGYLTVCRDMGVDKVIMAGTSALREAENTKDLLNFVQERHGLTIQILSGEEEARLSYLTVEREMGGDSPLLVLDIGGGSTEIIIGDRGWISVLHSLDLGAVRLTERFLRSDPVAEEEFQQMMAHIFRELRSLAITPPKRVVGLGGTISTLSAVRLGKKQFDMSVVHDTSLSVADVEQQVLLYKRKTQEHRLQIPGLPRDRADVILAGAAILLATMKVLDFECLTVSCHGLRYGLLYAAVAKGARIEKAEKSC